MGSKIAAHYRKYAQQIKQNVGRSRQRDYPDITRQYLKFLYDLNIRNCTCDAPGPEFVHIRRSRRTRNKDKTFPRPKCPICRENYYINMRGAFIGLIIGAKGGGKSTTILNMCLDIWLGDMSKKIAFYQAPHDFVEMLKLTDWCLLHRTTCGKALGLDKFESVGTDIFAYDEAGNLIQVPSPAGCCRLCKCQGETVDPDVCESCPFFRSFENVVINVNDLSEVPYNSIFVIDEGILSVNAKQALTVRLRQFGKFVAVTQHQRVIMLVASQEYNVIKGIRNQVDIIFYKKLLQRMVYENWRDPIIRDHANKLTTLEKNETLVFSSADTFKRKFGIIRNKVPQFWDADLSQSYAAETSYLNENEQQIENYRQALMISESIQGTADRVLAHRNKKEALSALRAYIRGKFSTEYSVTNSLVTQVMDFYYLRQLNEDAYYQIVREYLPDYVPEPRDPDPTPVDRDNPLLSLSKETGLSVRDLEAFQLWTRLTEAEGGASAVQAIKQRLAQMLTKEQRKVVFRKAATGVRNFVRREYRRLGEESNPKALEMIAELGCSETDLENFSLYCVGAPMIAGEGERALSASEKTMLIQKIGKAFLDTALGLLLGRTPLPGERTLEEPGDADIEPPDPDETSYKTGMQAENLVAQTLIEMGGYVAKMEASGGERGKMFLPDLIIAENGTIRMAQVKNYRLGANVMRTFLPLTFNTEFLATERLLEIAANTRCPRCGELIPGYLKVESPQFIFILGKEAQEIVRETLEVADNRKTLRVNLRTGEVVRLQPNIARIENERIINFLGTTYEILHDGDLLLSV